VGKVAIDFGTCNTVMARFNETTQRTETVEIPGVTTEMRYRLTPDSPEEIVHVAPSLIHYSATETLIGDQVLSRGLAEHCDTLRWFKRAIGQGVTRRQKTAQGHKSPQEAGTEFMRWLLHYAGDRLDFANDEFTFTAPVEAFENYQDWLFRVIEAVGIRRARLLDEPTACILGYQGAMRRDEHFLVFDFGGGTLDVSVVRVDLSAAADIKAIQLGQAGRDLGGMDIDRWIAEDFSARHALDAHVQRELEALILREAEATKIALSDPRTADSDLRVLNTLGAAPRAHVTSYTRGCPSCAQGRAGTHAGSGTACLGCLLCRQDFTRKVRETVERALENAAIKAGVRRDSLTGVVVTGGASLSVCVRALLRDLFGGRVAYARPFDAVVHGACRGVVAPILQHDYAIESYDKERKRYEFMPLFPIGTEYPTPPKDAVRFWAKGSYDGMTRIGMKIFEVSRMQRRALAMAQVDAGGRLREDARVASDHEYICLNSENPTFIVADPPVNLERDRKRFLATFQIDGNRRLLVSVLDNLSGKTLLEEHPVVRL
jgi:molecular chaperone DnaK (HSP70)